MGRESIIPVFPPKLTAYKKSHPLHHLLTQMTRSWFTITSPRRYPDKLGKTLSAVAFFSLVHPSSELVLIIVYTICTLYYRSFRRKVKSTVVKIFYLGIRHSRCTISAGHQKP